MNPIRACLVLVAGACLSASVALAADAPAKEDLPQASNPLERMHLKNAKCVWTDEIGNHIYQCLKDNFGMNAHWCHNEAMELLCPKQLGEARVEEGSKPKQ